MKITPELKAFQRSPDLYERVVGDIIAQAPRGGVLIDGGAHVGQHTQPMLQRADASRVYAVEAIPRLCEQLAKRFANQPLLRLVQGAISKDSGRTTFRIAVNAPGYSGLMQRELAAVTQWEAIEVDVYTLDQVVDFADAGAVGLIKLDLEGAEFDALRGARGLLARSRPLVVFENGLRSPAASYGYGWAEFSGFMASLGYEVHDFFGNAVDQAYWDATLQTYMFVAVASGSAEAAWLQAQLPAIVARHTQAGTA